MSSHCLVTGCCGLLGSSVVNLLVDSNISVLGIDIDSEKLKSLSEHLRTPLFTTLLSDSSTSTGLNCIDKYITDRQLCFDGAVHAAYPRSPGWGNSFEDLVESNLCSDLNAQLGGAILFSKFIINHFNAHKGGSLIHVSSIQGCSAPKFQHYSGLGMTSPIEYSAIKAGIISITRWLAKYYANRNIRVNCVSPGGILSSQSPVFVSRYRESCTNIGMLEPSHVASVIVHLLSSHAIAINGQNIIVDDGWSL